MIIRMAKVEILGPRDDLLGVLEQLRGRGVFQPDPQLLTPAGSADEKRLDKLILDEDQVIERRFFLDLQSRIGELVQQLPEVPSEQTVLQPLPIMDVLNELVDRHLAEARRHRQALGDCREEADRLAHELRFWQTLVPLIGEAELPRGLALFAITLRDEKQLGVVEDLLQAQTAGRYHLSTRSLAGEGLAGLLATDVETAEGLRAALTEQHLPELSIPEELADLSPEERVAAIEGRLEEQRQACRDLEAQLAQLAARWLAIYRRALAWLDERLALYQASAAAFATRQCFVIQGWMAAAEVEEVRELLSAATSGRVVIEQLAILEQDLDRVPVLLRNPGYFAPFQVFSRLLPLPKYTSYDPTPFMALFLPLMFGLVLGDLGYGLLLALIAFYLVKRFPERHLASDLGKVLGVAAAYTLLFGLLFGELFGDLGEHWLGLEPLWIERSRAVLPMIAFALTVGTVHILLGICFGFWTDLRRHRRREALFKIGLLATVILLALALVSWWQPAPWLATRPLLVAVGILLPVLVAAGGLLAPLELIQTLGNIISYVRLMAIGLGSVLLAVVANRLGGMTGDLLLGIFVAGLLHAFNLLLGVFAPTVHSLRLHYVEFFSKFLDLGGRRFEPLHKEP